MKTECASLDAILGDTVRDHLRRFKGLPSKYTLWPSTYDMYSDRTHQGLSFFLQVLIMKAKCALTPCWADHAATWRDHLRRNRVGTCRPSPSEVKITLADMGQHRGTRNTDGALAGVNMTGTQNVHARHVRFYQAFCLYLCAMG